MQYLLLGPCTLAACLPASSLGRPLPLMASWAGGPLCCMASYLHEGRHIREPVLPCADSFDLFPWNLADKDSAIASKDSAIAYKESALAELTAEVQILSSRVAEQAHRERLLQEFEGENTCLRVETENSAAGARQREVEWQTAWEAHVAQERARF